MSVRRAQITVHGHVQGVSFRYYTLQAAQKFGVHGWVRNDPGGAVTAEAEGEEDRVRLFVKWCHEGSPWSHVESVDVAWGDPAGYSDFRITP